MTLKIAKVKFINSLGASLLFWFFSLSIIPLAVSVYQSFTQTVYSLENAAQHEIKQSSNINHKFIKNWFYYREVDIKNWSHTRANVNFLNKLEHELKISKKSLQEYVKTKDYEQNVLSMESDILAIVKEYDYIYDLFLIDKNGNILYSVKKENDLATNLINGKYANTKFAKAYKQTIQDSKVYFSDLELYPASKNEVAGFLTAPLISSDGKNIGAIAVQIKLDRIFALFDDKKLDMHSFKHYLVGEDGYIRSNISKNKQALKYSIQTKQFKLWHAEHGSKAYKPTEEDEKLFKYLDDGDKIVYGLHKNIEILGVKWALISEVDESSILDSISKAKNDVIIFFILIMFFVIIVSLFVTKKITKPIISLYEANIAFANGERDVYVTSNSKGEIALLEQAFNKMVKTINLTEKNMQEQKHALDAHSIVAITDIKGNITFVNDKFIEISGFSKDELIGKNHRLLNSGFHSTEFWKEMYVTISHGEIWNEEVCNISKDGSHYWVDTTVIPFMDDDGKPESYIAIRTDITGIKDTEIKLIKANEIAQESVKTKGEFLASMSHEIRTPMNGVIGMLDLLMKTKLDDTQMHQASLAQSSATALLSLINDILDFSKVEAGKMELEYIDFDLRDELGKFTEAIAFRAQEKGVDLLLDTTYIERKIVNGDPGRIRQILSNIVGNSVKFTSEGYILIRAILNTSNVDDVRLIIEMSDTGIGIPENKIDTLFDSFSQVDASTTRKYGGTGLGLAIVKKLCEIMDGSVNVISNYGYGSTFTVDIALNLPAKSSLVMPYTSVEGKKILILDTSEYSVDILQKQLEHWGMEVSSSLDSTKTMDILKKEKFDIMFIDMFLKDIDVCELTQNIRNNPKYDNMKLVMMTSLKDRGNALQYKKIGIDSSFPKPATTNDLFAALDTMFGGSGRKFNQTELEKEVVWDDINILLVEDNLTNQLVANGILEGFNLEADIANDGEEALQILSKNEKKYDIILMDCQMPKLDGYETTGAIRNSQAGESYKNIPIVAMTANAMAGDREKCELAGMDDYLSKPINPRKLKEKLKKYLSYTEGDNIEQALHVEEDIVQNEVENEIWNSSEALARLGGSHKLLSKIINVYLEDTENQLQSLKSAIDSDDREGIKHYAHTIKGSAGNLSALKLQDLAKSLEYASATLEITELKDISLHVEQACRDTKEIFDEYLFSIKDGKEKEKTITKYDLLSSLKALHVEIINSEFIDSEELELFKVSFNASIDDKLKILKNKVDNFLSDEALEIIDDIVLKLGEIDGK